MTSPSLHTDIVDVYVFRQTSTAEFLQLHRCRGQVANTWQPVMGHIEPGESALAAALRELAEETSFSPTHNLLALWQLEIVNSYFLARQDCIMLSPGFAAQVAPDLDPRLDDQHDAFRWVPLAQVDSHFLWPGQRQAIAHIARDILDPSSPVRPLLQIPFPPPQSRT
ncbi:MAG: NUDIX domain-containing protein [Phycisphaeraceae bacterium]|nr:NUDIX domain-containing protein [Phycisphaeraceae bacterium]